MTRKLNYPINLAYCIDTNEMEADSKDAMRKLLDRLPEYFKRPQNNRGFNVFVSHNNDVLIINIRGDMEVDYSLVNTSSPSYHIETDGETSFDCMTREDFDQIIVDAFEKCATDILDTDIYEHDGSHVKTVYLSDSIRYFISDFNDDVGYPHDDDIWGLVA